MGAEPLRRASTRATPTPSGRVRQPRTSASSSRAAATERRARERHLRRRRRDLLEDAAVALVVTIFALIVSAGLGVIALLEVPVGAIVLASLLIERRRRGRRARAARARADG
jgi:hypothetical protein